jgi:isopenicillin N synthase-like dioxygenase
MKYLSLPLIDFQALDQTDTLRTLDSACRNWGAFQLVGHDLTGSIGRGLLEAMDRFFSLPSAHKRRVMRTRDNPWGFFDSELTRNTQDWKEVYDYGPPDGQTIFPQLPKGDTGFQAAIEAYYGACQTLAFELLGAISSNLGSGLEETGGCFRLNHTSFLRLNYYPLCDRPAMPDGDQAATEGHLGINPHTDAGALTLLLQDEQAGLEIYRDGKWHRVAPSGMVVHLGDIVQVWSNDRYRAPLHRVVASSQRRRFSAPYFFNPSYDTNYQPLSATVDRQHPARYLPINWGEFRALRAEGDYANYGEEVQISQYRRA